MLADGQKLICQEVLPKGVGIPSVQMRTFKPVAPGQTEALIEVLQAPDGTPRDKCALLGHFTLREMPPKRELTERIEVVLKLDANGMLTATARDRESGKTAELEIDYKKNGGDGPAETGKQA